jgi:transcriptional regulator with XRE-family HTH domain
MTATVTDLTDRIERSATRVRTTIRLVRDYRGLRTDDQLGAASGIPRSKVQRLVTGESKMTIEAIAAFASALDVPDYVLSMESDDALRWVMDNSPNGPTDDGGTPHVTSGNGLLNAMRTAQVIQLAAA